MGKSARSDADLVRAALSGERTAFDALIERHFGLVYLIAIARLDDAGQAEDLAQEVFLRAHIHLRQLDPPEKFPAWLSRIARNLAIDWLRRGQRASRLLPMLPLEALPGDVADPEAKGVREVMAESEESQILKRALSSLPPDEREIVMLRFAEDLGQREIAERLGMHQTTVGRTLKRALEAMRGQLEPILRETAPTLRPATRASLRAVAVIAAFEALAPAAKAALISTISAGATSTSTLAEVSSVAGSAGLLMSLSTWIAGGAKVMATGKGIAATVVAVAAIGGGTLYLNSDNRPQAPAAVSTVASADESVTLRLSVEEGEDWFESIRFEGAGWLRWPDGQEDTLTVNRTVVIENESLSSDFPTNPQVVRTLSEVEDPHRAASVSEPHFEEGVQWIETHLGNAGSLFRVEPVRAMDQAVPIEDIAALALLLGTADYVALPPMPISPGFTWTNALPNTGFNSSGTHHLEAVEIVDGRRFAIIRSEVILDISLWFPVMPVGGRGSLDSIEHLHMPMTLVSRLDVDAGRWLSRSGVLHPNLVPAAGNDNLPHPQLWMEVGFALERSQDTLADFAGTQIPERQEGVFNVPTPPHPGVFAVGGDGNLIELALVPEEEDRRLEQMADAIQTDEDVAQVMGEVRRVFEEINAPSISQDARFLFYQPDRQSEMESGRRPDLDQVPLDADLASFAQPHAPGDVQMRLSSQVPGLLEISLSEPLSSDLVAIAWQNSGGGRATWLGRIDGETAAPISSFPDHPGVFAMGSDGTLIALQRFTPDETAELRQRLMNSTDVRATLDEMALPFVPRGTRSLLIGQLDLDLSQEGAVRVGQTTIADMSDTAQELEIQQVPGRSDLWEITLANPLDGDGLTVSVTDANGGQRSVWMARVEPDFRETALDLVLAAQHPVSDSLDRLIPHAGGVYAASADGAVALNPIPTPRLDDLYGRFQRGEDPVQLMASLTDTVVPRGAHLYVRQPQGGAWTEFLVQQSNRDEMASMAATVNRGLPGARLPFVHTVSHELREVSGAPGLAELVLSEPLTGDLVVVVTETPGGEVVRFALLTDPAPQ